MRSCALSGAVFILFLAGFSAPSGSAHANAPERAMGHVLPATAGDTIQALAEPFALRAPVLGGFVWTNLTIHPQHAEALLRSDDDVVRVVLSHPEGPSPEDGMEVAGAVAGLLVVSVAAETDVGRGAAHALAERILQNAANGDVALWLGGRRVALPGAPEVENASAILIALQLVWGILLLTFVWEGVRRLRRATPPLSHGAPGFAAALLVLAGAARLVAASWGPGDLFYNVASAFSVEGIDPQYGSAPNALLRALFLVAPVAPATFVVVNLILGSLAPLAGAALMRTLGARPLEAALAGLFLAAQPLLIHHAGNGSRQALVLFLGLVTLWAAARFFLGGGAAWFAMACAAFLLAFESRTEAGVLLPLVALLAWSVRRRAALVEGAPRRMLLVIAALAGAVGVSMVLRAAGDSATTDWIVAYRLSTIWDRLAYLPAYAQTLVWFQPDVVAVGAVALAAVGCVFAARRRESRGTFLAWGAGLLSVMTVILLPAVTDAPLPPYALSLASARYQTLLVAFLAMAAAYGLAAAAEALSPERRRTVGVFLAAAGVLVVGATSARPLCWTLAPRTIDAEFRFLLAEGAKLPPGEEVRSVRVSGDVGLRELDRYMGRLIGRGVRWTPWDGEVDGLSPGAIYYHSAACSSSEIPLAARALCDRGRADFGARPMVESDVVAAPFAAPERYDGRTVRIGFYRMAAEAP